MQPLFYNEMPAEKRRRVPKRQKPYKLQRTVAVRPLVQGFYDPMVAARMRQRIGKQPANYVDLAAGAYNMDTTGSIVLLATVPQGAGYSQRIGKKIRWKSVELRGSCMSNSTTTIALGTLVIVYDRRPTGVLPAITDILVSANSKSFNNATNEGRFKVCFRRNYVFVGNDTTAGQHTDKTQHEIYEYIKLRGLRAVFKAAATGAIGDIEQGALYVFTVGDTAAGNNAAVANFGCRIRFYDIAG